MKNQLRYVAYFNEERGQWQIWDNQDEQWIGGTTEHIEEKCQEHADELNENACAICGNQCDEAHGQTRYGRVCESCCDEFVDDSGEVDWSKVRT